MQKHINDGLIANRFLKVYLSGTASINCLCKCQALAGIGDSANGTQ